MCGVVGEELVWRVDRPLAAPDEVWQHDFVAQRAAPLALDQEVLITWFEEVNSPTKRQLVV